MQQKQGLVNQQKWDLNGCTEKMEIEPSTIGNKLCKHMVHGKNAGPKSYATFFVFNWETTGFDVPNFAKHPCGSLRLDLFRFSIGQLRCSVSNSGDHKFESSTQEEIMKV